MRQKVAVLIMAAGASTRMKAVKQLLPWGNTTLIAHICRMASESIANSCYIVLGAYADRIKSELNQDLIRMIENPDWEAGLGKSISTGVKAVLDIEKPDGILIMLCDQPLMDTAYLNKLIDTFKSKTPKIVGTNYGQKIGVPAVFESSLFPEMCRLDQSGGAAELIEQYQKETLGVDAKGKQKDMDTPEEYQSMHPGR